MRKKIDDWLYDHWIEGIIFCTVAPIIAIVLLYEI